MSSSPKHSVLKQNTLRKLTELKSNARVYSELINNFQTRLRSVSSSDNFSTLIEEITAEGKKLYDELFNSSDAAIPYAVQKEIFTVLEADNELSPFLQLLRYSQTFHDDFINTSEHLNDIQLSKVLSAEQLGIVRKCINDIKALKPTAELIREQVKLYRIRLAECSSLDELMSIEAEIKILDKAMQNVYKTMIAFPEDENTAGLLIDYLEKAPHLQSIMKSFNLLNLLSDDILDNTARLHEQMDLD